MHISKELKKHSQKANLAEAIGQILAILPVIRGDIPVEWYVGGMILFTFIRPFLVAKKQDLT